MKHALIKSTLREIRGSFGRFFAIFAIIALGVGFFSGVKITTPAMIKTIDNFVQENQLFDYRLVSTVGWSEKEVQACQSQTDVRYAEGSFSYDVLFTDSKNNELVMKVHSILPHINGIGLTEGRMPEKKNECVLDAKLTDYRIGDVLTVSGENETSSGNVLNSTEYTIVGFANASYYINFERGTTSLGNGKVSGFMYVPEKAFSGDTYTEIFVRFDQDYKIYSKEYKEYIKSREDQWESYIEELAADRFLKMSVLIRMIQNMEEPETFLLDRNTNIGYACFESDSQIVGQVARVFPVFFILVAALVCMTTMSRMVEDQRSEIGTMKALGYSDTAVMGKYLFYAGSAALLGCVTGYMIGIVLFPRVIWMTYELMYFDMPLCFVFDVRLAIISLVVSILCSIGTTVLSCNVELSSTAATLMRPRAPKAGKRVFLEYITFIWNRLKFLHKVSVRNILRYKRRLFMMVLGISGCTALLVTGFGLNDSVAGFADMQFDEIQVADASVTFSDGKGRKLPTGILSTIESVSDSHMLLYEGAWDLVTEEKVKSITLEAPLSFDEISGFMKLHTMEGNPIPAPAVGDAVISNSIAERYNVKVGDEILLRSEDMRELHVHVSHVFENHVYNYIFIDYATMEDQLKRVPDVNAVLLNFPENTDMNKASATLMKDDHVSYVTLFQELKTRISKMMDSLNYVVLLVIISAAGLAFVVIYNLTNINITERIREIATIKVLGFFKRETSSYVFRENVVLTALGILVGLFLGIFLHRFVMSQIVVDLVSFRVTVKPISFLYSILFTLLFNFLVSLVMNGKLEKINMAESLKSVE